MYYMPFLNLIQRIFCSIFNYLRKTYYLREVKAPEGYLLNTEDIQFKVIAERDWENPLVVACEDVPAMGKIHLKKTDKESEEALAGAVFNVIAAENITTPDGTLQAAKAEVVTTLTTGSDGTATSTALHFGKYKLVETKAPNGYVTSEKNWDVTLSYADQETEIVTKDVSVTNTPNEVKIKKSSCRFTGSTCRSRISGLEKGNICKR